MKPFVLRPIRPTLFLLAIAVVVACGGLITDRFPWWLGLLSAIGLLPIGWRLSAVLRVDKDGFTFLKPARGEPFDVAEALYLWEEIEDVMLSETRPQYVCLHLRDGTTSSDMTIPPRQIPRLIRAVEEFGGRPVKTP